MQKFTLLRRLSVVVCLLMLAMGIYAQTNVANCTDNVPSTERIEISPEMQAYINHLMGLDQKKSAQSTASGMHKVNASSWSYPTSTPANPFGGGNGTEANPYLISTPQHLANLAYMVNNGNTYSGKYFKMTDDIVLNTGVLADDGSLNSGSFKQWIPIGGIYDGSNFSLVVNHPFKGTFNGAKHFVSGLYWNNDSYGQIALFGATEDASIINIGIKDSYVYAGGSVGGIVGAGQGILNMKGCFNEGTIIGYSSYVGGLIGRCQGYLYMESCYNSGPITGQGGSWLDTNGNVVGGLIGGTAATGTDTYYAEISYCYNTGNVYCGNNTVGGIIGFSSINTVVSNCYNTGYISNASGSAKGAITGGNYGIVDNCYYSSDCGAGEGSNAGTSNTSSLPGSAFENGTVLGLIDPEGEHFVAGPDGKPVLDGVGEGGLVAYTYETEGIVPEKTQTWTSWTSTNHSDNSTSENTINFAANTGSQLSFDWWVDSETDYDYLFVFLDGSQIVKESDNKSGTYSKTFSSAGNHTLYMYYEKDGSRSQGTDQGSVTNIKLYTPTHEGLIEESVSLPSRSGEVFGDWTSTNKEQESTDSKTIQFTSLAGDKLTFDWETSSEIDADFLNIYLDGTPIVYEQSGNGTSGSINQTLSAGNHELYMEYVKDDAKSRYNDEVYVRNIKLVYAVTKHTFETLSWTDGSFYKIAVVNQFSADAFTYTRTFNNTNWQALYVPFSMNYEDWADDFEVAEINDVHQWDDDDDGNIDRTALEVVKVKSGSIMPNMPYLIKAKTTGEKAITLNNATLYPTEEISIDCSSIKMLFTFTGSYSTISGSTMMSNEYYALGDGKLQQAASAENALKAMRWYMGVTDRYGAPVSMNLIQIYVDGEEEWDDTGTTIKNVVDTTDEQIYDLSGRRVEKTGKGLYIMNGKKIYVK